MLVAWPERVAFLVGGGLSNNEHAWNLKRDVPEAREFDEMALDSLRRGEWDSLAERLQPLTAKARPEAELRHLEVLRGFLSSGALGEVLCYESAYGVGAALVEFPVAEAVEAEQR